MLKLKCCRSGCLNRVYSMLWDVEDDTVYEDPVEPVPVCAEHLVDYMASHGGMSSHRCDEYGNAIRDLEYEAKREEQDRLGLARALAKLSDEERLAYAKATGGVQHD